MDNASEKVSTNDYSIIISYNLTPVRGEVLYSSCDVTNYHEHHHDKHQEKGGGGNNRWG
jgi:hypothetical protein